jgi:hypothetical protein
MGSDKRWGRAAEAKEGQERHPRNHWQVSSPPLLPVFYSFPPALPAPPLLLLFSVFSTLSLQDFKII